MSYPTSEKPKDAERASNPPSYLLLKVALAHMALLVFFLTVGQWAIG